MGDTTHGPDGELSFGDLIRLNDLFHDSALLHLASSSGLFDLLKVPASADQVAARKGWVPRKTRIALDALVAIGLLVKDGDLYRNTDSTTRFLTVDSDSYMGGIVDHQRLQWNLWARMDEVLASEGVTEAQQEVRFARDRAANDAFNRAMARLSQDNIAGILAIPELAKAGRVLDVCGGHGAYVATLARENPELTGEVWDLEPTRQSALRTFAEFGVADRVAFRAQDVLAPAAFADQYADACMLNDCLHYFDEAEVRQVIGGAASTLGPGGLLAVTTMTLEEDRVTPAWAAGFSLHMMLNARHGGLHPTPWIEGVMRDAGLDVDRRTLGSLGRVTLLEGRKPAG